VAPTVTPPGLLPVPSIVPKGEPTVAPPGPPPTPTPPPPPTVTPTQPRRRRLGTLLPVLQMIAQLPEAGVLPYRPSWLGEALQAVSRTLLPIAMVREGLLNEEEMARRQELALSLQEAQMYQQAGQPIPRELWQRILQLRELPPEMPPPGTPADVRYRLALAETEDVLRPLTAAQIQAQTGLTQAQAENIIASTDIMRAQEKRDAAFFPLRQKLMEIEVRAGEFRLNQLELDAKPTGAVFRDLEKRDLEDFLPPWLRPQAPILKALPFGAFKQLVPQLLLDPHWAPVGAFFRQDILKQWNVPPELPLAIALDTGIIEAVAWGGKRLKNMQEWPGIVAAHPELAVLGDLPDTPLNRWNLLERINARDDAFLRLGYSTLSDLHQAILSVASQGGVEAVAPMIAYHNVLAELLRKRFPGLPIAIWDDNAIKGLVNWANNVRRERRERMLLDWATLQAQVKNWTDRLALDWAQFGASQWATAMDIFLKQQALGRQRLWGFDEKTEKELDADVDKILNRAQKLVDIPFTVGGLTFRYNGRTYQVLNPRTNMWEGIEEYRGFRDVVKEALRQEKMEAFRRALEQPGPALVAPFPKGQRGRKRAVPTLPAPDFPLMPLGPLYPRTPTKGRPSTSPGQPQKKKARILEEN